MLLELPSGIWGQARSIQVESAESKEIVPQVVSSSNADFYIAKDFTEYRQHFTQHLDSGRLLQCAQAAAQEAYPQVDFMYAMPGLFHYGHPLPQAASLSRQWLLSLSHLECRYSRTQAYFCRRLDFDFDFIFLFLF